jgi:hypothetical protein
MKFTFFLVIHLIRFFVVMGQSANSEVIANTFRSLDLIIVDNSQPDGNGMELTEPQFIALQTLTEKINYKQDPSETLFFFYVSNRSKHDDITNLKSRARYVNDLQSVLYDLPAVFITDRNWILQRILSRMKPFDITHEINVYYFFPPKYYDNNNFSNKSEIAKFINVLPREIASLSESDISLINVYIYLPYYFQNFIPEKLIDELNTIANFKNDDESFPKINFHVQLAD